MLLHFDDPWIAAVACIDNNFYHLLYIYIYIYIYIYMYVFIYSMVRER